MTNPMDFSGDLASMDEDFASTAAADTRGEDVPNGDYQVEVVEAHVDRSKSSDAILLKWQLRVAGPNHVGRMIWKNSVIAPDKLKWLKADLATCGLDVEALKLSDLPARAPELAGVFLKIRKTDRGVFVNGKVENVKGLEAEEDAETSMAGLEDDTPF